MVCQKIQFTRWCLKMVNSGFTLITESLMPSRLNIPPSHFVTFCHIQFFQIGSQNIEGTDDWKEAFTGKRNLKYLVNKVFHEVLYIVVILYIQQVIFLQFSHTCVPSPIYLRKSYPRYIQDMERRANVGALLANLFIGYLTCLSLSVPEMHKSCFF